MRIIGLDYGQKQIGVAISDRLLLTAQGLEVINYGETAEAIERIAELKKEYRVEKIVLGLPRNMNGTLGEQAERVLSFKQLVAEELDIPVITWDERLSTSAAEHTLLQADLSRKKRKQVVDKVAAVLILQSYLDNLDRTG